MTDEVIISTKDRPGSYDAIETAKPDEPLFPIQGGDPFGPPTVLHWAGLARAAGLELSESDPQRADKLLRKASDAEQVAWAMQAYQANHEEPQGGRARYNEPAEPTIAVEIDASDRGRSEREARIKGAERLHNVVGQGGDIAELLEGLGCCPPEVAALRNALDQIKAAALAIEPRRENERS